MRYGLSLIFLIIISKAFAADYASKGCYALSDLESLLSSMGSYTYQTNSYCEIQCAGHAVAATLNGATCYCGDKLPANIQVRDSSNCATTCQGYPSEVCGGNGYLSVYTNGDEDTSDEVSLSNSDTTSSTTDKTESSTSVTSSTSSTTSPSSTTSNTDSSTPSFKSSSTTSSISSPTTSSSTSSSNTTSIASSSSSSSSSSSITSVKAVIQIITSIVSASGIVQTLTTTAQIIATHTSSSSSVTSHSSSSSSGISKGAIAGTAIGSIAGLTLLISLIVFLCVRSRRSEEDDEEEDIEKEEKSHHSPQSRSNEYYGFQPQYLTEDHRRLSNGSLPDGGQGKTLRIVNPDEDTLNDITIAANDKFNFENESEGNHDWKYSR